MFYIAFGLSLLGLVIAAVAVFVVEVLKHENPLYLNYSNSTFRNAILAATSGMILTFGSMFVWYFAII